MSTNYFTEVIDYTNQTTGRMFTSFSSSLANYKIILFMTSLWITGSNNAVPVNPVQLSVNPIILNQTHY